MEVLYHIRPYFVGIFPYIGLIYCRYLQFRFLKWPLIIRGSQAGSSFWQSDTPTYLDSFEAEQFPVEHQYRPATIRTSPGLKL